MDSREDNSSGAGRRKKERDYSFSNRSVETKKGKILEGCPGTVHKRGKERTLRDMG